MVDPRYYAARPEVCLEANKRYVKTPKGRAARARAIRNYRDRNKIKLDAHNAVAYALRTGVLQRWPCEVCGDEKAEAHHPHYGSPLLVTWLCQPHHREAHAITKDLP
jgi:hypothetical protein